MYYVTYGIVPPRFDIETTKTNHDMIPLSNYSHEVDMFIMLMKTLRKQKAKKLDAGFAEFFNSRAIKIDFENETNDFLRNVNYIFHMYKKFYTGEKKSGFKFYLIDYDENSNKIKDIITTWKTFKED